MLCKGCAVIGRALQRKCVEDQCNGRAKNRLLCNGRAKKREAEAQPGWAGQWNGKEERRSAGQRLGDEMLGSEVRRLCVEGRRKAKAKKNEV